MITEWVIGANAQLQRVGLFLNWVSVEAEEVLTAVVNFDAKARAYSFTTQSKPYSFTTKKRPFSFITKDRV